MKHAKICLIHPNPGPECETFIHAQAKSLQGPLSVLHGGHMPLYDQTKKALHPNLPSLSSAFSPNGIPQTKEEEKAADNMALYFTDNEISVVLAEYGPTGVAMLKPCALANVSLVTHFHGFDASLKPVLKKYKKGYARLFKQASSIIAVSLEMKKDLIALGAPENKIDVNPYGVDASLFTRSEPDKAPPHFIAVGRFVDKKAPEILICAFAKIIRQVPDAMLTMIGDGVLREGCIRLARNLGLSDQISFPGVLPHKEIAKRMQKARCFVQHSVAAQTGDKEGTPNAVLEASASGLPVVATRHAGIKEAVVHEKTGLLCEEHDVMTMARHMLKMAIEPMLAQSYGKAGQQHITTHYDYGARIKTLQTILDTAAGTQEN